MDGINYCVACLGALAMRPAPERATQRGPVTRLLAATGYVLTLALLMWGVFELAFAVRPS